MLGRIAQKVPLPALLAAESCIVVSSLGVALVFQHLPPSSSLNVANATSTSTAAAAAAL